MLMCFFLQHSAENNIFKNVATPKLWNHKTIVKSKKCWCPSPENKNIERLLIAAVDDVSGLPCWPLDSVSGLFSFLHVLQFFMFFVQFSLIMKTGGEPCSASDQGVTWCPWYPSLFMYLCAAIVLPGRGTILAAKQNRRYPLMDPPNLGYESSAGRKMSDIYWQGSVYL